MKFNHSIRPIHTASRFVAKPILVSCQTLFYIVALNLITDLAASPAYALVDKLPGKIGVVYQEESKANDLSDNEIETLFNEKKYDQLIQTMEQLKTSDLQKFEANQHMLARVYLIKNKLPESILHYQQVLDSILKKHPDEKNLASNSGSTREKWKVIASTSINEIANSLLNIAIQKKNQDRSYTNNEYLKDLQKFRQFSKDFSDYQLDPADEKDFTYRDLYVTGLLVFDLNQEADLSHYLDQLRKFQSNNFEARNKVWLDFLIARVLQKKGELQNAVNQYDLLVENEAAKKTRFYPSILHHAGLNSLLLAEEIGRNSTQLKTEVAKNASRESFQAAIEKAISRLDTLRSDFSSVIPNEATLDIARCYFLNQKYRESLAEIQSAKTNLAKLYSEKDLLANGTYQKALSLEGNVYLQMDQLAKAIGTFRLLQDSLASVTEINQLQLGYAQKTILPVLQSHRRNQRWAEMNTDSARWLDRYSKYSEKNLNENVQLFQAIASVRNADTPESRTSSIGKLEEFAQNPEYSFQLSANWELAQYLANQFQQVQSLHFVRADLESLKAIQVVADKLQKTTDRLLAFPFFQGERNQNVRYYFDRASTWNVQSLVGLGNFSEAEKRIDKLLKESKDGEFRSDWNLLLARSILEPIQLGSETPAETSKKILEKVLTVSTISGLRTIPQKSMAQFYLGRANWSNKNLAQGISAFYESQKLKSDWAFAKMAKQQVLNGYDIQKDWNSFQKFATEFEQSSTGLDAISYRIFQSYGKIQQKEYQPALALLKQAKLDILKETRTPYRDQLAANNTWWMARCYRQMEDLANAKLAYQEFQKNFPSDRRIQEIPVGFLLAGSQDSGSAMSETIERKTQPLSAPALFATAQKSIEAKNWLEAEKTIQQIIDSYPSDADFDRFLYHLGWVQLQQGKAKESRNSFNEVLKLDDGIWKQKSRFFLAKLDFEASDFTNAEAGFLAVSSDSADEALAQRSKFNYAKVLQQQKKWAAAADAYQKLVADHPGSELELLSGIGASVCFLVNNEADKAAKILTEIESNQGVNVWEQLTPEKAVQVSEHANLLKNWSVANSVLKPVDFSKLPEDLRNRAFYQKGRAQFGLENWLEAEGNFLKVSSLANQLGAYASYYRAVSLENQSLVNQARDQYKKLAYGAYGADPSAEIRKITAYAKYGVGRITIKLMEAETNQLVKQEYRNEAVRWFAKAVVQTDDKQIQTKAKDWIQKLRK